ncbi:MAG: formyl transferase [Elusimicrobia bacterium]|nr:formyl transferase [Elusimicrobiota bacterium]
MPAPLKIAFIGCVEFSHTILDRVLRHPAARVVGVVTRAESPLNSDFRSLAPMAAAAGIPVLLVEKNQQEAISASLLDWRPDVIFCFGWPYLLRKEILAIPPIGTIGYHPTLLPKNRGRHPIIWTLALGLKETGSTFFFMDEGADSGDILNQIPIPVGDDDDSAALYRRLSDTALAQVDAIVTALIKPGFPRVPQDHARANYWRKREKTDGLIDWRMGTSNIYNLVRALTRPYPGAHCIYQGDEVKVWRCRPHGLKSGDNIEPGKVLGWERDGIVVRTGDGSICLIDHGFNVVPKVGEYIK